MLKSSQKYEKLLKKARAQRVELLDRLQTANKKITLLQNQLALPIPELTIGYVGLGIRNSLLEQTLWLLHHGSGLSTINLVLMQ